MERRRFVAGLASVAAVTTAATGCLNTSDSDGGPSYVELLPPAATDGFDRIDLDGVRGHGALNVEDYSAPRLFDRLPGIDTEDIGSVVVFGERRATGVATGDFDVSEVSTELASEGYVEGDGGEEYRLFQKDRATVALGEETCVRSALGTEAVREVVEVPQGEATAAVDADEDFSVLVDALGDGTFVTGALNDVGGPEVARGKSVDVERGSETAQVTFVRVYRTADVAFNSTETVNETARKTVRGPVAETDGRSVRVTGEVSVDSL